MEDFYGMLIGLILILGLIVVGQLVKSLEHKEETIEQLRTEVCTKEAEIEQLKKDIVGIVYNENLTLNMLKEEVLSLDSLYKQIMEGETKNEGNIQKNA